MVCDLLALTSCDLDSRSSKYKRFFASMTPYSKNFLFLFLETEKHLNKKIKGCGLHY